MNQEEMANRKAMHGNAVSYLDRVRVYKVCLDDVFDKLLREYGSKAVPGGNPPMSGEYLNGYLDAMDNVLDVYGNTLGQQFSELKGYLQMERGFVNGKDVRPEGADGDGGPVDGGQVQ